MCVCVCKCILQAHFEQKIAFVTPSLNNQLYPKVLWLSLSRYIVSWVRNSSNNYTWVLLSHRALADPIIEPVGDWLFSWYPGVFLGSQLLTKVEPLLMVKSVLSDSLHVRRKQHPSLWIKTLNMALFLKITQRKLVGCNSQ